MFVSDSVSTRQINLKRLRILLIITLFKVKSGLKTLGQNNRACQAASSRFLYIQVLCHCEQNAKTWALLDLAVNVEPLSSNECRHATNEKARKKVKPSLLVTQKHLQVLHVKSVLFSVFHRSFIQESHGTELFLVLTFGLS